jgi:hypothetical protein
MATITTTTTVTTEMTNLGRAAILYTNRYGAVPTLGRGGEVIHASYLSGDAGYRYESDLFGVVVGETATAFRVRVLNGLYKGRTYTVNKNWVELA